ncbi:MAG: outer membrane beta-barrel protein [Bacteroidetes bacterium]|nr:outer membrane beta-barrel protein [Bacteroidota bacterium]
MINRKAGLLLAMSISGFLSAQNLDSLKQKITKAPEIQVFQGTKIATSIDDVDTSGRLTISGYVSVYYASYTDSAGAGGYHAFPTVSPRGNAFGLNIAQLSARYHSDRLRGIMTLQAGDIPQSSWSPHFNNIQEANLGFRIVKNLWFDAGFFRTHIGLESIQPRENIAMSLATTTYYEPYFMSGAKLTWYVTSKWYLQVNAFNSFNTFVENNKNKAVGVSSYYEPNDKLSITLNTIFLDDSPINSPRKKMRSYTNLYMIYRGKKLELGAECNVGSQTQTNLQDTSKSAMMFSSLLALKYHLNTFWSVYGRGEYFDDRNEILTGPIENGNHKLVGLDIWGLTYGVEYKPIVNSYLRAESRFLSANKQDAVFTGSKGSNHQRIEGIIALGFWF